MNVRVSAPAGWMPLPVALLVPLPVMAGHLTLPLARSVPFPPSPPCQSGSGGALLRRRPLGTGHARFPGNRLGQALKA
jgi:hypothetical protein